MLARSDVAYWFVVQNVNGVSESDARDNIGEVNSSVPETLDILKKIEGKKDILLGLSIPVLYCLLSETHERLSERFDQ